MKITAQHFKVKITIEIPDDSDLHDMVNSFKSIAIGLGFQSNSWDRIFENIDADELIGFQIFLNDKNLITNYKWDFEKLANEYIQSLKQSKKD